MMSAFACSLASAQTSGRLIEAFTRDGFGPRVLATVDERTRAPKYAIWGSSRSSSPSTPSHTSPAGRTTAAAPETTSPSTHTASTPQAGAVALMIAYVMVEIAAIWFVNARRFAGIPGNQGKLAGTILPALAATATAIVVVLGFNVYNTDSGGSVQRLSPVYIGLVWVAVGVVIALAARELTKRIGQDLAKAIKLPAELPARSPVPQAAEAFEHKLACEAQEA
jgi:amino acid transporter